MTRSATDLRPKDVDAEIAIYFTVINEIESANFDVGRAGSVRSDARRPAVQTDARAAGDKAHCHPPLFLGLPAMPPCRCKAGPRAYFR